jgi:hypothetical protein
MPRAQLSDLATGYEFPVVSMRLTPEMVERYRRAVEDDSPIYRTEGAPVPPSGLVALSLGALLQTVVFPPGLMHFSQEAEFSAPAFIGQEMVCKCRVRNRSLRSGNIILVLEFTTYADGRETLKARTNLLFPVDSGAVGQ